MFESTKQIKALSEENRLLKERVKQLEAQLSTEAKESDRWCILTGSPWEAAVTTDAEGGVRRLDGEQLVSAAFRQVKYELFCASVDLLGYSLTVAPNRNCIVRSVYFLDDPHKQIEFVYDHKAHCYNDVVWSAFLEEYESTYFYWVVEHQSLSGFLSEVFMDLFNRFGHPPARPRGNQADQAAGSQRVSLGNLSVCRKFVGA